MAAVRYGLPAFLILLGVVLLPIDPNGMGIDLFAMLLGAGLSVLLLNWLFRLGSRGDDERQVEAAARDYYSQHGHWPDEAPPR
jgi:hypothetical protein